MKDRAIGLIRVSTELQATTNDSIEGQKKDILKWANENNIEIEKLYLEPGSSAFVDRKRHVLDKIQLDLEQKIISPKFLLVYKFSRFTRKASLTADFKNKLLKRGIKIVSITEPLPEDEDGAFISETVIDMVNEISSRDTSRVVQDRLNTTAENGYYTGGKTPFGYLSMPITFPDSKIIKKN